MLSWRARLEGLGRGSSSGFSGLVFSGSAVWFSLRLADNITVEEEDGVDGVCLYVLASSLLEYAQAGVFSVLNVRRISRLLLW